MTEKRTSAINTRAVLMEAKIQSSANRLVGRIRRRLITATRHALRVLCQCLFSELMMWETSSGTLYVRYE